MQEALNFSNEIIGKWKKNHYRMIRKLGTGGTAEVFLVEGIKDGKCYAMKVSQDNLSLNREYQLLMKYERVDFVVKAYEMDDFNKGENIYHYLLLEYIEGENLKGYIENAKLKMITILGIILILLKGLETFHNKGHILGDLKLENVMFDRGKKQLKLIDLGGVVERGGTIKEYTPAYDRATWKCGMRKAEESYDLFTLTMILVALILGEKLNPLKQNKEEIIQKIMAADIGERLKNLIITSIKNQQYNREEFAKEINELYNIEKHNLLKKRIWKRDITINNVFKVSIGLLIFTGWLLIVYK